MFSEYFKFSYIFTTPFYNSSPSSRQYVNYSFGLDGQPGTVTSAFQFISRFILTLRTRALVLLNKSILAFSNLWNFNIFFTNYWTNYTQVWLYSLWMQFSYDSKFGHKIPKCWHFWQFCAMYHMSSAHDCHMESVLHSQGMSTLPDVDRGSNLGHDTGTVTHSLSNLSLVQTWCQNKSEYK